jgi:hypothetical protein
MNSRFESNAVSDVMPFNPRLSDNFPWYPFLLAAVKHKDLQPTAHTCLGYPQAFA